MLKLLFLLFISYSLFGDCGNGGLMPDCSGDTLSKLFEVTKLHIQQLARDKRVVKLGRDRYDFYASITGYVRYLKTLEKSEQNKAIMVNRQIKEIALREKKGELVEIEQVKKDAFDTGRKVRDAMMNIPDRISPLLATEKKENKVRKILTTEIKNALMDVNPYSEK
jgi:hypothetical protein